MTEDERGDGRLGLVQVRTGRAVRRLKLDHHRAPPYGLGAAVDVSSTHGSSRYFTLRGFSALPQMSTEPNVVFASRLAVSTSGLS